MIEETGNHGVRVERLARLARLMPPRVVAALAQRRLGPILSARVAGRLDPGDASRIARHLSPSFLADLGAALDPQRLDPIVASLPDATVVAVGRLLGRRREWVGLARLAALASPEALGELAGWLLGRDLLQMALHADGPTALERMLGRLPQERLASLVDAAVVPSRLDETIGLVGALSPSTGARVVAYIAERPVAVCDAFVAAVGRHRGWDGVLPSLALLPSESLPAVANLPCMLDAAMLRELLAAARRLDLAPWLVVLMVSFDDDHVAVAASLPELQDPDMVAWLLDSVGTSTGLLGTVLTDLGA